MPIFEYICRDCNKPFEALIYGSKKAECPHCHSTRLDQQFSTYATPASSKSSASAPAEAGCGMGSCGCNPDFCEN